MPFPLVLVSSLIYTVVVIIKIYLNDKYVHKSELMKYKMVIPILIILGCIPIIISLYISEIYKNENALIFKSIAYIINAISIILFFIYFNLIGDILMKIYIFILFFKILKYHKFSRPCFQNDQNQKL